MQEQDGTDGVVAYHEAMRVLEAQRAQVEVDEPSSIFDHARHALRKLTGHAADDFALGVVENMTVDPACAGEVLGFDEEAWD